ncbi:MAG: SDR family NAD(P)-dependent oxidoreductase, partial [Stackebrandtia sp.]
MTATCPRWRGRRAVITSAGRDFGLALAIELGVRGADVIVTARRQSDLDAAVTAIADRGGTARGYLCDLADPESIRRFTRRLSAEVDGIDVLVNNGARYQTGADLAGADDAEVVATMATATGTILLVKQLLPMLSRSRAADILTMVSA